MAKKIKKEYDLLIKDIESNIKNKQDVKYIKERMPQFLEAIDKKITTLERKINKKETEIDQKMETIQNVVDHIENLIYEEFYADDEEGFEIYCPYCESNFYVDIDEYKEEVKCPFCNNIVELDWSGDVNDWEVTEYEDTECSHNCKECNKKVKLNEEEMKNLMEDIYSDDEEEQ